MNALVLAAAYLRHHAARAVVLVLVAALILTVPVASQVLLRGAEARLTERAAATPLVLGARGSQLDLVMGALYFSEDAAPPVTMAAADAVWDSGLALPIPLHTVFEANGARIVGTTLDYLDFRGLELAAGRPFAVLGEAVLGAAVADRLGLTAGDTIVSSPQNLFDLDGVYPLEMAITGVLARSGTPDDDAIFTDVKTAWVIAGIGHGHDDVITGGADAVRASAAIEQFTRITPENIESFHFHGAAESYPLTAVIAVPPDARAATILRGRYLDAASPVQAVVPENVVEGLVARIFRIKSVLDAVTALVAAAALAAVGLAVFLSWRLRASEVETAFKLGARRGMILWLLLAETGLILGAAILIAGGLTLVMVAQGDSLLNWLLSLSA